MVLWEITLGTAYFLGLKRTYKLALLLQRRVVGPQHPQLRQFFYRRTRAVFEMAMKVHQSIQQRDIEVGKNLGNWILRWLDPAKPTPQLRPTLPVLPVSTNHLKHVTGSNKPLGIVGRNARRATENWNKGRLFFTGIRPKSLPTISMMVQSMSPAGVNNIQYRYASNYATRHPTTMEFAQNRFVGVFRKDIAHWMMQ